MSAHCSFAAVFPCSNPWQTNQQMALMSVYIILIYQLACYQNIWYLVRRTKGLSLSLPFARAQQADPLTACQTIILHKTNTKNKVAGNMSVYTDSQSYQSHCDGPAKQTERQPDPPANTADLPSWQAYR